jgi:glycosyltransferase involved in cell wall biosynthesis
MKIMHVIWGFQFGGAETMLVDIANRQCIRNEVEIVLINNDLNENLLAQLDPKIHITRINRPLKSRNLRYVIRLNVHILFSKADIIHFHQDNIIRYLPVRFLKRNLCLTIHSVEIIASDISKYNYVFAISDAVRKVVNQQTGINPPVVLNGIDIQQFNRTKKKKNDAIFRIVQTGRLNHSIKGQHISLKAIHQLVNKYHYRDVHLDMIGEGDSEQYLKELAGQLQINEYVTFLGLRDKNYIRDHLTDYDLFVQPSFWEGFGLTLVEAISAFTPMLVSNVDGMNTITNNGELAYTFEPGNVDDYADTLYQIIQLPPVERENLAQKAYHYAVQHFDISSTVENYRKYYEKIVSGTFQKI